MLAPDADQVGDVEALLDVGDQLVGRQLARLRDAGWSAPGDGVDDTPRAAWPVVARPSSRAVALSSSQVLSTPSSISAMLLAGDALGVERPRAQAAPAQRIVDDADAGAENLLAHACP